MIQDDATVHLTMDELAHRWRRKRKTVERHYERWGLRPLRFGGRLLFPISQVIEVEQRAIRGELVGRDDLAEAGTPSYKP